MSPDDPARELRARFEALLDHARAAGLAETAEELLDLLEDPAPDPDPVPDGEVPIRFGMVGASPPMQKVYALLERLTQVSVSVLIEGETGTGKELVARALHDHGPRKGACFLAENCAAVPANLLESELFGHVKGAFTGAVASRDGHFVAAHGGTLFLDEIGDMPLDMQAKLLRVLESGEVRPVGSNQARTVDVRMVAATNRDLAAMCKERTFREDLYFRLNVVRDDLPPLRERSGDLPHLVRYFAEIIGRELDRSVVFTPSAVEALGGWHWPGNVRELENEMRRAAALTDRPIRSSNLSSHIRS